MASSAKPQLEAFSLSLPPPAEKTPRPPPTRPSLHPRLFYSPVPAAYLLVSQTEQATAMLLFWQRALGGRGTVPSLLLCLGSFAGASDWIPLQKGAFISHTLEQNPVSVFTMDAFPLYVGILLRPLTADGATHTPVKCHITGFNVYNLDILLPPSPAAPYRT